MKQEFYLIRDYYIDLNKSESERAVDILVILKDENGIIHKSTTMEKVNGSILEKLVGKDYKTIIIT